MDVIVNGACGRMGTTVRELIESESDRGMKLVAGVDPSAPSTSSLWQNSLESYTGPADIIIDFSYHGATAELMAYAKARKLPCVIATTGQTEEELKNIDATAKEIPVFFAANYSLGIAVLTKFAKAAAAILPNAEVEIVEAHHDQKLDAPSGTALALANAVKSSLPEANFVFGRSGIKKREKNEIGIHSLRINAVVGVHEVIIASGSEILSLKHTAESRTLFAEGALTAATFLVGKPAGLYSMDDLVEAE